MKRHTYITPIAALIAFVFVMSTSAQNRSEAYRNGKDRTTVETKRQPSSSKANAHVRIENKSKKTSKGISNHSTRNKQHVESSYTHRNRGNSKSYHEHGSKKSHYKTKHYKSHKGVHFNISRHGNDRHFKTTHRISSTHYAPTSCSVGHGNVNYRRVHLNGLDYYLFNNRVHRRTYNGRFIEVLPPTFTMHLPVGSRLVQIHGHYHYYNNGFYFVRVGNGFEIRIA